MVDNLRRTRTIDLLKQAHDTPDLKALNNKLFSLGFKVDEDRSTVSSVNSRVFFEDMVSTARLNYDYLPLFVAGWESVDTGAKASGLHDNQRNAFTKGRLLRQMKDKLP